MPGIVYLVGAGPGDPGLMTRRSLDLIARADAILYDRLIPPGALSGARADADLRYVGKQPGGHSHSQDEINALLVQLASSGLSVVRLKGGDPFVFGRGGEEAQALAGADIPFEVVPGVTAGVAAPAYAGIPVTHRDDASAVAFITAHERPGRDESAIDWAALARFPGTLVFYMGVGNLARLSGELIDRGRPRDQPAAVIERGTLAGQRTVSGTLADIAEVAEREGIRAPAITLVGAVADLRRELRWVERRPLSGRSVIVTRARPQASVLAARLGELGARVIEAPAIRVEARPAAEVDPRLAAIDRYALVCLTSPKGAALLMASIARSGRDARALADVKVAAIGSTTAAELGRAGIVADIVPARAVAEGLVEALASVPVEGRRVLVARAGEGRDVLPQALAARGAEVDVVALYDTRAEVAAAVGSADYITFTSSSTVRYFTESQPIPAGARIVSIGPVTSETIRGLGLNVDIEARSNDIDGLVDALVEDATP